MYPNPRRDYEITSVFRIPKMGTIKLAIFYSQPLNPRLSAPPIPSFPQACCPSQATADGHLRRWSAPQIVGLDRAMQTPHPHALPSSLCCARTDTAHTQRSGALAVKGLSLSAPTAHR